MSEANKEQGESSEVTPSGGHMTYALWMLLAAVIVGLDQVSKLAIIRWVDLYQKIEITSFFNVTHQQNTVARTALTTVAGSGGSSRCLRRL